MTVSEVLSRCFSIEPVFNGWIGYVIWFEFKDGNMLHGNGFPECFGADRRLESPIATQGGAVLLAKAFSLACSRDGIKIRNLSVRQVKRQSGDEWSCGNEVWKEDPPIV